MQNCWFGNAFVSSLVSKEAMPMIGGVIVMSLESFRLVSEPQEEATR